MSGKCLKTLYSCTECKLGFHVNCFSAYHNFDMMSSNESVFEGISKSLEIIPYSRKRKTEVVMSVAEFNLDYKSKISK